MEILQEISKEVFEKYVPAAKMPERNDSVYERLKQQLQTVYDKLVHQVIGSICMTAVESDDALKGKVLRFICLQAFVMTVRSLDLVLTATGFGIVSTNTMTPASKARVDALLDDCRLQATESLHAIIASLFTVAGWGDTYQARESVQVLFWDIRYMKQHTLLPYTADSWQKARALAITADGFLRKVISTEYMDELLEKLRKGTLANSDIIVMEKCNRFTGGFISHYDTTKNPNQQQLDAIMQHLETYSADYPTYVQSETYQARHAERYRNRKEDPTFFFM